MTIVGWSMNQRMTQQLFCDALNMALFRRGFPKNTILHSDGAASNAQNAISGCLRKIGCVIAWGAGAPAMITP